MRRSLAIANGTCCILFLLGNCYQTPGNTLIITAFMVLCGLSAYYLWQERS